MSANDNYFGCTWKNEMCFSSILVLALLLCGYLCFKDDTLNIETVLLGEVNHLFFSV